LIIFLVVLAPRDLAVALVIFALGRVLSYAFRKLSTAYHLITDLVTNIYIFIEHVLPHGGALPYRTLQVLADNALHEPPFEAQRFVCLVLRELGPFGVLMKAGYISKALDDVVSQLP